MTNTHITTARSILRDHHRNIIIAQRQAIGVSRVEFWACQKAIQVVNTHRRMINK